MELRNYWSIIQKWYWLIILGLVLSAGTSYVVSKTMKPVYAATVTLQVSQAQNPGVPDYNSLLTSERLTKTYGELLRKRAVLEEAKGQLGIDQPYDAFADQVSVGTVRDTQLIQVTVQDPSPQEAANIANKIAEVFIAQVAESQGGQLSAAREGLRQQLAAVENEISKTAAALDRLRSGGSSLSPEMRAAEEARLQSTQSQYQLLYSQLIKSE